VYFERHFAKWKGDWVTYVATAGAEGGFGGKVSCSGPSRSGGWRPVASSLTLAFLFLPAQPTFVTADAQVSP